MSDPRAPQSFSERFLSLANNLRIIRVVAQIIFFVIVAMTLVFIWNGVIDALAARGIAPSFDFLSRPAGFAISESPDWYSSQSTYGDAFIVGVMNTLRVVVIGLVTSTILGVLLGIFLLSGNWLIRGISRVYVEILRNTPLLVQLYFWYYVAILGLPSEDIAVPENSILVVPLRFWAYLIAIVVSWIYASNDPKSPFRFINGVLTGVLVLEAAFWLTGRLELPTWGTIHILGIIGVVLLIFTHMQRDVLRNWNGFAMGIGLLMSIQWWAHIWLQQLFRDGIIPDPFYVWGEVDPILMLGRKGLLMPDVVTTSRFGMFQLVLLIGVMIALFVYAQLKEQSERTGRRTPALWIAAGIILFAGVSGYFLTQFSNPPDEIEVIVEDVGDIELADVPFTLSLPERNRLNRAIGGVELSASYLALLVGLVIYTSAFIGEIVRAGIQAVPYGQVEAARALGLSNAQTMQMIVLPQALRVIIPPMGNQYLNLSKNSSLALVVAYADTFQVGQTVMNQSGQSIIGFSLILFVYLTLSLIISFFMNIANSRFQLVTR